MASDNRIYDRDFTKIMDDAISVQLTVDSVERKVKNIHEEVYLIGDMAQIAVKIPV